MNKAPDQLELVDQAELVSKLWACRPSAANYRKTLTRMGLDAVPFGDGDIKTKSPGTYRPVGLTCPKTCPYLGAGCYAEGGNVRIHQIRAAADRQAALHAAAAAMVWAARTGRIARLHVSGDVMGPDGRVDHAYVHGLASIAEAVRALRGGKAPAAWTYTHAPDGPWVELLRASGVAVRLSDRKGEHGAVVVRDREHARMLRGNRDERGRFQRPVKAAVCPAQLSDTDCSRCQLCWTRSDLTIAFLAHGFRANAARANISTTEV